MSCGWYLVAGFRQDREERSLVGGSHVANSCGFFSWQLNCVFSASS